MSPVVVGFFAVIAGNARPRRSAWISLAVAALVTIVLVHSVASASAEETGETPRIVDLRAGFDGHFKVGYWTSLDVTIEAGSQPLVGTVEIVVLDGDAVPSRVRAAEPITIAPGQQSVVRLYAKIGQTRGEVTASFRSDGQTVAERRYAMADSDRLAGTLPSERGLVVLVGSSATQEDRAHFASRGATLAAVELDSLPADWWGYEGVDLVVLTTGGREFCQALMASESRFAALETWVRMGGTVVVSVGRQATTVLAADAPLARLAPGKYKATVPLYQSTMIEAYAETVEPLETTGGRFSIEVPQLQDARGLIEVYAGKNPRDLPLVVRSPFGFGQVVWLALDWELPPLAGWRGRSALLDKLWNPTSAKSREHETPAAGEVTTLGFDDLAGQLRGALDQFDGVRLVPFWLVAAMLVAYIACIGPLDYLLVTHVLRRPEATWLTLAATVVAFSAGAYTLAGGLKGRQVRLNQVDLVDFDAESQSMRGTSWLNLFSPQTEAYDLALPSAASSESSSPTAGELFSWWGLPGRGFGGMNATAGSVPLFTEPYDFAPRLDALVQVPIAVWSTKAFVARRWALAASPIEARLKQGIKLTGTLENRLDEPLRDRVLMVDRWAYPIHQFRAGQTIDLETIDPQTVDTYLRHMTVQGDRNVTPPYDRSSFDVARIVEMMSSHALAGGEKYTALAHHDQGYTDLSELVRVGRAVFVGRASRPATQLTRDGQPLEAQGVQWTFYRCVFPIDTSSKR